MSIRNKLVNRARSLGCSIKQNRFVQGAGLALVSGVASAQTAPTFDTSESLGYISAGVAAGLLIGAAMTGAYIAMKANKLPRRGA